MGRYTYTGFPSGSEGRESACDAGDVGSVCGSGEPLEKGMATHSSILAWKTPMDRETWQAIVHGVSKSQTLLRD